MKKFIKAIGFFLYFMLFILGIAASIKSYNDKNYISLVCFIIISLLCILCAIGLLLRKDYERIKIVYHSDIDKIKRISTGDWIDLRAAEDVGLKAGEFKLISLGVSMELPKGYEAHIVPRSSTFKTWGIIQTNHQAVIDESYNGDNDIWKYPVYALRDTVIHKNDRICQFRIMEHQPTIEFEEVDKLEGEERGGFGSSGKN